MISIKDIITPNRERERDQGLKVKATLYVQISIITQSFIKTRKVKIKWIESQLTSITNLTLLI